jgi:hypothetical protein
MSRHSQQKYYVQVDEQGYVIAISQTGNWQLDTVELNLSDYNLTGKFISTYRLIDGKLVQDPVKLAEVVAEQTQIHNNRRIEYLKTLLTQTDYIMSKWVEEIISLDNPLTWISDVIKINVKYINQYRQVIQDRKAWRKEIEDLGG